MTLSRRALLATIPFLAAPSIVHASSLMPVFQERQFWIFAREPQDLNWWGTYLRRAPTLRFARWQAARVQAKYRTQVSLLQRPLVWDKGSDSFSEDCNWS